MMTRREIFQGLIGAAFTTALPLPALAGVDVATTRRGAYEMEAFLRVLDVEGGLRLLVPVLLLGVVIQDRVEFFAVPEEIRFAHGEYEAFALRELVLRLPTWDRDGFGVPATHRDVSLYVDRWHTVVGNGDLTINLPPPTLILGR